MEKTQHTEASRYDWRPAWLNNLADEPGYAVMFTSRGTDSAQPAASPYSEFNLCHYTGDSPAHIASCRHLLADTLGVGEEDIVVPRQIHSTGVLTLGETLPSAEQLEGVDGLVTTARGRVIGVSTADCLPVVAVDPVAGVAGAFHAGWRGALAGIVEKGIAAMLAAGASAENIRAWIGPAICRDCFEVGEEVAALFPGECVVRRDSWPRPHVDLGAYALRSLLRVGLLEKNIAGFSPELCTRCHPDRYFSARAEGIKSGRNFTFVLLK